MTALQASVNSLPSSLAKSKRLLLGIVVLSALISLLLALVGIEVWLRAHEAPRPPNETRKQLARDSLLGWNSIPAVQYLRNDPGLPAVVFVGDSFTQNARWTGITINELDARGARMNGYSLGVSGFGTTQEFLKLQKHYDEFSPRVVVLLFFAWNDLRDNFSTPGIYYNLETRARPYLTAEHARWELSTPFILPDFVLYSRVYERLVVVPQVAAAEKFKNEFGLRWVAKKKLPMLYGYTDTATWDPFYRPKRAHDPYVEGAWNATAQQLKKMHDFVESKGARFILVGIDNAFSVDNDVFKAFVAPVEGFDASLPLARLGTLAARHDITYINMLPALRELRERIGKKVYNGPDGNLSGHFEVEAEELIAKLVAQNITENLKIH